MPGPEIRMCSALPEALPRGWVDDLSTFSWAYVSLVHTQAFRRIFNWGVCFLMAIRILGIPDRWLQIFFSQAVTCLFIYSPKHYFNVNL